jgi:hypothetical protein
VSSEPPDAEAGSRQTTLPKAAVGGRRHAAKLIILCPVSGWLMRPISSLLDEAATARFALTETAVIWWRRWMPVAS